MNATWKRAEARDKARKSIEESRAKDPIVAEYMRKHGTTANEAWKLIDWDVRTQQVERELNDEIAELPWAVLEPINAFTDKVLHLHHEEREEYLSLLLAVVRGFKQSCSSQNVH